MNLTFIFGCIGTRIALALYAKKASNKTLTILGYSALIPVIGWLFIYTYGIRKTGFETGGKKIWWNSIRPIHALIWGLFAYLAINNYSKWAWVALIVDVAFGLFAYLLH